MTHLKRHWHVYAAFIVGFGLAVAVDIAVGLDDKIAAKLGVA